MLLKNPTTPAMGAAAAAAGVAVAATAGVTRVPLSLVANVFTVEATLDEVVAVDDEPVAVAAVAVEVVEE
jgi:hypothetical protein